MDCSNFERGCVTMTHGLLREPQMTCQSSQTGSVCVQTDLALPIHYSECLAKPGSAHPLLITAGRHIRLTPSSVDTHALVHTPESYGFHCAHAHKTVAVIIIFIQPLFSRSVHENCMALFVACKKVPQWTTSLNTLQTHFKRL